MDTCDATTSPVPCSSLETLEQQITELAAHIHAANYRLLCLIAEFDRHGIAAHVERLGGGGIASA